MTVGGDGEMWLVDFRHGEVRLMSIEEERARREEVARRQKLKDGVVYVDCEPPGHDVA